MKKTILEVYALAICFMSVICVSVCLAIAGYNLVRIGLPHFTIDSYTYDQYQTNDAYWKDCGTRYCEMNEAKAPRPAEADLTRRRNDAYTHVLLSERRDALQTLVKTLIVMLITSLVFNFHWGIAKRARSILQA